MVVKQQPVPQSVQIHVTSEGVKVQEGAGEPKVATTAADIPDWAEKP